MQGSPPPPGSRIRFEDDRFLAFPDIRWSLSHMRELLPTVNVGRGGGAPSELGATNADQQTRIDRLAFDDLHGRRRTWEESLPDTYCDGILVMYRGRRVY